MLFIIASTIIGWLSGIFITSFSIIQILIVLFFGLPFTSYLEKSNLLSAPNPIRRRYLIVIPLWLTMYFGIAALLYAFTTSMFNGFIAGSAMTILLSIGKLGRNQDNIDDYVLSNREYIKQTSLSEKANAITTETEVAIRVEDLDTIFYILAESSSNKRVPYEVFPRELVQFAIDKARKEISSYLPELSDNRPLQKAGTCLFLATHYFYSHNLTGDRSSIRQAMLKEFGFTKRTSSNFHDIDFCFGSIMIAAQEHAQGRV
jgi:hypothetical protein